MKSTHKVEIVPIELKPHPNADSLSIVEIYGYTVCARTEDWQDKKIGAYIPPDSLVDTTRPEFVFLHKNKKMERIKVKKLRGIISMGLLVPAPEGSQIGDNVAEQLGVEHYEPPLNLRAGGDCVKAPRNLWIPKYDVDTIRRYSHLFQYGEKVIVTEKIHGANARYVCHNGEMFCGSRTQWKREDDGCIWWRALRRHPEIEDFCKANPDTVLFGEVYGQVQDLRYGLSDVEFAAFDMLYGNTWFNYSLFASHADKHGLPIVPLLFVGQFNWEKVQGLAEGPSLVPTANHVREGCVVKPVFERTDPSIGRVILKLVGNGYYERKDK